jgi:uncharacterized phage protein (TIGR02220 family)
MKNTYYFPHDYHARHDPKMEELFFKYNCEGIGVFWNLTEMLYENNGKLPLEKIEYYANALRASKECIASVIKDFGLFDNDGVVFWSDRVNKELVEMQEKRLKAQESAKKRWHPDANAMPTQCAPNAIKESKVKESKVNNTTIVEFFDYFTLKTKKAFKLTPSNHKLITDRLVEGYTIDQLKQAVDNFVQDDWEGRSKHLDLIYCIGKQRGKPDSLEKWLNYKSTKKQDYPMPKWE